MIDKKTWGGTTSVSSYSYTYDAIETAAKWNPSYSYDQIGNRKTSTGIESFTYSANALNQYADIQVSSLSSQPFYDLDGNLTGDGGNWTYNWNNENRLASATDGSRTIHFTYDYQGRLVKKDDGRTIEVYVYDGWNRIATFDSQVSTLSLQVSYLWGLDLSGSFQGAGGIGGLLKEGSLYPTYDANGNIMQKLDGNGVTVMNVAYDPFGNIISGTLVGEYGFSTKPFVEGPDWYYYGYRYYDSVTGRWPNRDPIGEWAFQFHLSRSFDWRSFTLFHSNNRYSFVENEALRQIDILGLFSLNPKTGNWTGADWSGGQRPSENDGEMGDAPPFDNQDACAKAHDICWNNCAKNNQPDYSKCDCLKSGRAKSKCRSNASIEANRKKRECRKPCDDELVRCNRNRNQSNDTWKNDVVDGFIEGIWGFHRVQ